MGHATVGNVWVTGTSIIEAYLCAGGTFRRLASKSVEMPVQRTVTLFGLLIVHV